MILEKRGNPRKSRRVRLPSSSYTGKTRFTPSAEDWWRIEKPFGVGFSAQDCQQLIGIVDAYFGMQPFETAAPFANDAQAYLNDVRTKANAFWRSLEPPALQREAAFFVQRQITQNFHEGQRSGPHKWNEVIMFMSAFIAASGLAATALRVEGGGFVEGYAWRELIRGLDRFCQERSLRVGASKGLNKSRRGERSPGIWVGDWLASDCIVSHPVWSLRGDFRVCENHRHSGGSFASLAADLGYSDATIAALVGHAGRSTTSRYTHAADAVLLAAADAVADRI